MASTLELSMLLALAALAAFAAGPPAPPPFNPVPPNDHPGLRVDGTFQMDQLQRLAAAMLPGFRPLAHAPAGAATIACKALLSPQGFRRLFVDLFHAAGYTSTESGGVPVLTPPAAAEEGTPKVEGLCIPVSGDPAPVLAKVKPTLSPHGTAFALSAEHLVVVTDVAPLKAPDTLGKQATPKP